jgi:periplasmic nitrate reductase NapD
MSISGILVHINPDRLQEVSKALQSQAGVDIYAETPDGRLVITAEESESGKILTEISLLDGVLSATLIYHNDEPSFRGD